MSRQDVYKRQVAGRNYSIDGTVPDQPVQKAEIILGAGTNPSESNDHVGDVEPAKNQQTQEAIPNKQGARKTVLRMSWVCLLYTSRCV